jgi:CDP-diacylglycerol---serine O-phosphatidyltransferase
MARHFSMIRSFHLADLFTLANAGSGVGAMFAVMSYVRTGRRAFLVVAAAAIGLALVFDVLDGRIARWRHTHSVMGRELDSLADVISFGAAPAALAFGAGMNGGWDQLVLIYFVGCGVSRLARYNVTAEALAAGASNAKVKYFEGTPIPSSIGLVGLVAVAAAQGRLGEALWGGTILLGPWRLHPLVALFGVSGSLMISKTIRIPKL